MGLAQLGASQSIVYFKRKMEISAKNLKGKCESGKEPLGAGASSIAQEEDPVGTTSGKKPLPFDAAHFSLKRRHLPVYSSGNQE